jgi:outer membrane protein assembly factor BamE (lipoprotein component of BamABCDE complex)
MRMTRTILLLGAAGLILSLAAGCESRQNTRGNLPTKGQIALITPGVHGREDVRTVLGAPSVVSTFDENIWYYIGRRTTQYAFFKRSVLEQQVLIVRFAPEGPVNRISRLEKSDGREVELVERETPSAGRELGLFEQLFGNIGRFAGDDGGQ